MITLDTSVFTYMLDPKSAPPIDPGTGQLVTNASGRVQLFISELAKQRTKILIPTPVLAETLARTGAAAPSYLEAIRRMAVFKIENFDDRAAIETSLIMGLHWKGRMQALREHVSRHRVKFDLQIVATAAVHRSTEILSDDAGVKAMASLANIPCRGIADLPEPPADLFSRIS
ncbi:hypothetical protein [Nitrospirillum amazonense]|uniref:hypothetical protein n=1 Tax=Nitrospirillum amazonense TaxID=28077 RepID=UPI0011AA6FA4|nr:hypothetical protein [Nitrospirillum amazonense]